MSYFELVCIVKKLGHINTISLNIYVYGET